MTLKIVPDMTYNVFGGTLNLAQSINNKVSVRTQSIVTISRRT